MNLWGKLRLLCIRLTILLVTWWLLRFCFFLYNQESFAQVGWVRFLQLSVYGIRYDLSILIYINGIFIFTSLIPWIEQRTLLYQRILWGMFLCSNLPFLLFELTEIIYYPFVLKRSTANLWSIRQDFLQQLPGFIAQYWLLIPITIFISWLWYRCFFICKPVEFNPPGGFQKATKNKLRFAWKALLPEVILFLFSIGLSILAARGGVQLRPLGPIDAAGVATQEEVSLITPSSMTLLHSLQAKRLPQQSWIPEQELNQKYTLERNYAEGDSVPNLTGYNVILIIVESLSQEYMDTYHPGNGYTPFLDSLAEHSLVCTNMFANGRKSNEGIPALIAGIPPLMKDPFVISIYQSNSLFGLGALFKNLGYSTSFFHGAHNGSFKFDVLAKAAGYDTYIGRNEYPYTGDDDGHWGIWDEPFFYYQLQKISQSPPPFFSTIFTLTNHHPFQVPEKYQTTFPPTTPPIQRTIRYTDHALRNFFHAASKQSWFQKTLFVITADHTNLSNHDKFQSRVGVYRIPCIFYTADHSFHGTINHPVSQLDLLPTIAHLVRYTETFKSFGHSIFDHQHPHTAIMFPDPSYQYIRNDTVWISNGETVSEVYWWKNDSLCTKNLLENGYSSKCPIELQATIQQFNAAMNNDNLVVKKEGLKIGKK